MMKIAKRFIGVFLFLFMCLAEIPVHASFQLSMLDVGQGLCVLVEADGHRMLYDGGGRSYSSYVVSYLKKHEIDQLDYIFVSHYDEDHISGLVGVLNQLEVNTAVTPDYEADSKIYLSLRKTMEKEKLSEEHPTQGTSYELGDAIIKIIGPKDYKEESENNRSIAISIRYGEHNFVITGDAEEEEEKAIVNSGENIKGDLYIVGHHGSATSSSERILDAISPEYAFISVGKDNAYGHPSDRIIDRLKKHNILVYRSDLQGEVTAYSDGDKLWIDQEAVMEETAEATEEAEIKQTYILNTNTKKFHNPSCPSVKQMKESNKKSTEQSRERLMQNGYDPCGNCKP